MDKGSYKWMKKDGTVCKNIKVEKCTFKTIGKGVATSQFTKDKFHTGIKITGNKFTDIKTEENRNDLMNANIYRGNFDRRVKIFTFATKTSTGWGNTDQELPVVQVPIP